MNRTVVFAALVALAAVAGLRCKRVNGAYCDGNRPCPSGFACDLTTRECHTVIVGGGGDMSGSTDMAGCTCSGTTPICVAMTCVSCLSTSDPNGACVAASPSTPYCLTTDPGSGACVACRDNNDCSGVTPFCDMTTKSCRGCIADTECPSLICELTPGAANHGQCVPASQVEYADVNAATNGNGLTPTTPRVGLQDAINHAVGGDARPFVHVAAGTYNESVGVNNKTIYLVGADGAIIHPTSMDALGSQGATGSLTVRNLTATATAGNGANCNGAKLTIYRSKLVGSSQNGVYSNNCDLLVDGAWVDNNTGSGFYIAAGNFQVINTIITRNSNSGGFYQLAGGTTTIFANNTVADNTASGTYAGVKCASSTAISVRNSILWDNKGISGATIGETDCSTEFVASDDPAMGPQSTVDLTSKMPGFKGGTPISPDSYHLLSTSPCIDEASGLYAPNHDFDFAPRPDATTMKPDIGAVEVQ